LLFGTSQAAQRAWVKQESLFYWCLEGMLGWQIEKFKMYFKKVQTD
jgi:hypothetical protein